MSYILAPEEWRDVVNYEGLYRVSSHGRVLSVARTVMKNGGKSFLRERMLKPARTSGGYLYVNLSKNRQSTKLYVHQLVLEAFVGPCPERMEARHFHERDPSNNDAQNLRWGSHSQNMGDKEKHGTDSKGEKHFNAKLTDEQVIAIRERVSAGETNTALAREFGVVKKAISQIARGKRWRHVGGPITRNGKVVQNQS